VNITELIQAIAGVSGSGSKMINLSAAAETGARERFSSKVPALRHVRLSALEVLLNHLHLVFDPQFELLETDLFQFLVFREISFSGERTETLRVLGVFLNQPTKFVVAGEKLFANGIDHPEEPPALCFHETLTYCARSVQHAISRRIVEMMFLR
jgi:hypothetical protein